MQFLSLRKWESRTLLLAHLNANYDRTLLLGEDVEAPRAYYSFSAITKRGRVEIGIISAYLGPEPTATLLEQGQYLLVGHDLWLTSIEMDKLAIVTQRRLVGPFFEFLSVDSEDEIVVFHEVGVLRVNCKAEVKWSVDTDIVEGWTSDGKGDVILTVMGSPPLVVSLSSGAVSEIRGHTPN